MPKTIRKWPKREGDGAAIFLVESAKDRYELYRQNEQRGPWYQGSVFRKADLSDQARVNAHLFAYHQSTDGNGNSTTTIVGVAHDRSELSDKIYASALRYSRKLARATGGKVVDKTAYGARKRFGLITA